MINAETQIYGIIGKPIKHSLSPVLHTSMFNHYNINAVYAAFEVSNIEKAVEGLRGLDIKGVNVTIPYKKDVLKFIDEIDSDAEIIRAVNTIKNINGRLIGYNTDYLGFIDMFQNNIENYENKIITVIGAGGASRAVVYALYKLGIRSINLINRTIKNAESMKKSFEKLININIARIDDKAVLYFSDIIINCTSAGLHGNETAVDIDYINKAVIMDVIYTNSTLIKQARGKNLTAVNGMDMFISQAFHAFKIFTDVRFDKKFAYDTVRGTVR